MTASSARIAALHPLAGGLELIAHGTRPPASPIQSCPLPDELILRWPDPCIAPAPGIGVGLAVAVGQCLVPAGPGSHAVHAPASGRVASLGPGELRLRPEPPDAAPSPLPPLDPELTSADALRERLTAAGVAVMADFLDADRPIHALVINAVECEPWLAREQALLHERAPDVLAGARVLARAHGATRVVLAVAEDRRESVAAALAAMADADSATVELAPIPGRYPFGDPRLLTQALTGQVLPPGGEPRDLGLRIHDAATALAAWRATAHGEALTHRVLSVGGPGIARPGVFEVAIGTPLAHLVARAGGHPGPGARLRLGGRMTGRWPADGREPIGRDDACLVAMDAEPPQDASPCIRCGACAEVCPAGLQPQSLFEQLQIEHLIHADADRLADCIECGCCDLVCPSHIALTPAFAAGKRALHADASARQRADAARARYQARNQRLARDARERSEREAERRRQLASGDAVAAAIARAKARRHPGEGKGP